MTETNVFSSYSIISHNSNFRDRISLTIYPLYLSWRENFYSCQVHQIVKAIYKTFLFCILPPGICQFKISDTVFLSICWKGTGSSQWFSWCDFWSPFCLWTYWSVLSKVSKLVYYFPSRLEIPQQFMYPKRRSIDSNQTYVVSERLFLKYLFYCMGGDVELIYEAIYLSNLSRNAIASHVTRCNGSRNFCRY